MERRDFLKSACAAGLCSCAVAGLIAGEEAKPASANPPKEDWRIVFGKQRYTKLVSTVAAKVDPKTFSEIIEEVGRFCSEQGFAKDFVGNLDGYCAEMQKRWGAKTEIDRARGVVELAFDVPGGDCACPLLGKGLVPAAACRCSVGAIRHGFTVVMQRAVECELKESALRGDARCSFEIRVGAPA
jgi:hypothetical protein